MIHINEEEWLDLVKKDQEEVKREKIKETLKIIGIMVSIPLIMVLVLRDLKMLMFFMVIIGPVILLMVYGQKKNMQKEIVKLKVEDSGLRLKRRNGDQLFVTYGEIEWIRNIPYSDDDDYLVSHWGREGKNSKRNPFWLEGKRSDFKLPQRVVGPVIKRWSRHFKEGGEFQGKEYLQELIDWQRKMLYFSAATIAVPVVLTALIWSQTIGVDTSTLPTSTIGVMVVIILTVFITIPIFFIMGGLLGIKTNKRRLERGEGWESDPPTLMDCKIGDGI